MPEQQKQDDDDHDDPNNAVTAAAIIAAAIAPISTAAAEQEDEDDDQKDEGHRTPRRWACPPGLMRAPQSRSSSHRALARGRIRFLWNSGNYEYQMPVAAAQLDAVKEIGPARAAAIIKCRSYKRNDELLTRKILTQGVYDKIKDKIVGNSDATSSMRLAHRRRSDSG